MLDGFDLDWQIVSYSLELVGVFFIVNSLIFKKAKRFLNDQYGIEKKRPLREIRDHVLSQVQLMIGFIFFISGKLLQIGNHLSYGMENKSTFWQDPGVLSIVSVLGLAMAAVALFMKIFQILWTRWTFKRLLIEFYQKNPTLLDGQPATAKEVGQILGVAFTKDDSIVDYLARVKRAMGIDDRGEKTESGAASRSLRVPQGVPEEKTSQQPETHPATPPRIIS